MLSTMFGWPWKPAPKPTPVDPAIARLFDKVMHRLDRVESNLEELMAASFENLTREVSEAKTVMASAKTLIEGLKAKLDTAIANLPDQTKLDELSAELDAGANELAAAVAANTPAEEPAPEPEPTPEV